MTSTDLFSAEELERYHRHFLLPEIQAEGQHKLKRARVLVVGAGGLGCPLLLYLTAAGVGHIGIADFDVVEKSNLHRQVLFGAADEGKLKADTAVQKLRELNPHVQFSIYPLQLTSQNALDIIRAYDIVADCTDNFPARYLISDACVLLNKVDVYASVHRFEGQLSVFHAPLSDGKRGPNYRDLFPVPPPADAIPSCAEGGVLGVLPGIMGSMQALEIIKLITGAGEVLEGKLFLFDAASFQSRTIRLHTNPDNPLNGAHPDQFGLIDYDAFCGMNTPPDPETIREISVHELQAMRQRGDRFQLIDVREPNEYALHQIGGDLMPLGQLDTYIPSISRDRPVVVMCKAGVRSAHAIRILQHNYGFTNLLNLRGGILAWMSELDSPICKV